MNIGLVYIGLSLLTSLGCSSSQDDGQSQGGEVVKTEKYSNPIIQTSLPDPTVVKASDGYFYLYLKFAA